MKHTCIFNNAIVIALLATGTTYAQTPELKPAPAAITIDGNAQEWGEMSAANEKAKIAYTIANDKDNLYLVIKTNDIVKQRNIIGAGITFSINTKGKKSTTHMLTFPFNGQDNANEYIALDASQLQAKAGLTKYQKIRPQGFADITDEQLSVSNPYGIKVSLSYDDTGYMVYEEAIPLTLFHTDNNIDKEWAFNIKINGLANKLRLAAVIAVSRRGNTANTDRALTMSGASNQTEIPGISSQRGAAYGNYMELTKPADFWVKFKLAKTL